MSTSDVSPPRQKGDISKGEMENQAGGQLNSPTAVPDPSHTELTKDEFVTKTSRNQPTEAGGLESVCDAQLSKEEATIPKFTACEEKRLSSREVEEPPKDEDRAKRRGDRLTDADVLTAECEDDLDYDELMESESYDRSTQNQTREFVDEEDEVKVHVTEDIEEGEISSDEEGEIKDDDAEEKQGEKEEEEEGEGEESRPPVSQAPKLSMEAEPAKLELSDASPRPLVTESTTRGGKEKEEEEEEGEGEEKEGRDREESSDEKSEASSDMEESEMHKEAQELKEDKSQLCRHFLHGKCSWGNQCRFLHANPASIQGEEVGPWMEKLPPHDRMGMHPRFFGPPLDASRGPPPPPHMREGGPRGFPGPQGPLPGPPLPGFVRGPPPGPGRVMPPHMGPPHPEMDMVPPGFPPYHRHHHPHHPHMPPYRGRGPPNMPYPPYGHPPGPRKDMKTAEVAEESEGWFRLRTIPVAWSSDEEEGGRRGVPEDLRHKLKRKKAEKESSNLDSEEDDQHSKKKKRKRQSKQGGGEEWTDPWARHGGKTEKVKAKKKKKKREPSTEPSENESSSVEETKTKPKKKEKQKPSKKLSESPKTEKKSRKKSDQTPSAGENSGSESEGGDKEKRSKKKGRKRSEKKSSSKPKKGRHDESSSNSGREEEEEQEETSGKKRKRKVGKKERKADSDPEEEKRSRRKRKHHHTSLSPSPERYREGFYPPHPFPFPPSDGPGRSRWPPHPGRPFDPHYPPPPRGYGGPEHERYSGPRKMDFEDWKRFRRDPPPPPVSQMGYRRGPPSPSYPPYEGVGHRKHLPSHPVGQHYRDRGSSEDRSHSVTPAPNHSPSSGMDSSPERNLSQKGERKDFPEPHKGRGREEKRKGESSTQRSSRSGGESGGRDKSKTLSRREKLLQELQAIDEVIERKKSKKRHGHS